MVKGPTYKKLEKRGLLSTRVTPPNERDKDTYRAKIRCLCNDSWGPVYDPPNKNLSVRCPTCGRDARKLPDENVGYTESPPKVKDGIVRCEK